MTAKDAMNVHHNEVDRVLDALGHQTRREILRLLREQPLAVGAIASQFPITRPAISKHLRVLQQAGLVRYRTEGTSNIFYLQRTTFRLLHAYLEEFWDEALDRFQENAARIALTEQHDLMKSSDDESLT